MLLGATSRRHPMFERQWALVLSVRTAVTSRFRAITTASTWNDVVNHRQPKLAMHRMLFQVHNLPRRFDCYKNLSLKKKQCDWVKSNRLTRRITKDLMIWNRSRSLIRRAVRLKWQFGALEKKTRTQCRTVWKPSNRIHLNWHESMASCRMVGSAICSHKWRRAVTHQTIF